MSELAQAKLELKLERQNKFATNEQHSPSQDDSALQENANQESGKRGAPVGHPGWFRPTPTAYDWDDDVGPPSKCPHCHSDVVILESDPQEHFQEDIIDGQYANGTESTAMIRRIVFTVHCGQFDVIVSRQPPSGSPGSIFSSRSGFGELGLNEQGVYLRVLDDDFLPTRPRVVWMVPAITEILVVGQNSCDHL